ncbi:MAG: hypothetical protein CVT98_07735 [Bacteroidetes bacterium HGW-Bacteroidetes-15]|nr:MAG: hypothetical protein CVT98_07735 [Bacteroidetes bacterium HGW-Bacteroidetes-15]
MNTFVMRIIRSKIIFLIFGFTLFVSLTNGQVRTVEETKEFKDKIFWGGAIGLTVGDITQIDIIPVAGIWFIPQWSVGIGGRYSYYSHKGYFIGGPSEPYRSHIWGGSVFTQILPIVDFSEVLPIPLRGGIMLHGEYERLYIDRKMVDPFASNLTGKTWVELFLVGVGYRQRLGEKAALNIMLLWEVSNNNFSPYPQNPMLRVNLTL